MNRIHTRFEQNKTPESKGIRPSVLLPLIAGVSALLIWVGGVIDTSAPIGWHYFGSTSSLVVLGLLAFVWGWAIIPEDILGVPFTAFSRQYWVGIVVGVLLLWLTLMIGTTSALFHSSAYRQLLGPVTTAKTMTGKRDQTGAPVLASLSLTDAPLVSEAMAEQESMKLLSNQVGLGSQYHVGKMSKQVYKGHLVWVGFLEFNGFFSWHALKTSPGYVIVSASNPADAQLVQGYHLAYLNSAYFFKNVERKAWLLNPTVEMSSFFPEISPDGRPFWVIPEAVPQIGLAGEKVKAVLVLDAQTGQSTTYRPENLPAWINVAQPLNVVGSQVNSWGYNVHGWYNGAFVGRDTLQVANGMDLVYDSNGQAYWFLGLTSTGSDNGNSGFMLVDARTGHPYEYLLSGADQNTAVAAVEGLVRANSYRATNPLVFEVEGTPTYVMTLTDASGVARGYGMVNVKNYQVVAEGSTLSQTARAYADKLHASTSVVNQNVKPTQFSAATVLRIGMDVRSGNAVFYLQLQGVKPLLTGSTDVSTLLPILRPGDAVSGTFAAGDGSTAALETLTLDTGASRPRASN